MSESYRALCNDFYLNQKVAVKMDLPKSRDTILEFFERVRKQFPGMGQFRRYRDELALESSQAEMPHRWLAVRTSTIRSGCVNPETLDEGYSLHRRVLELAPAYLSVTSLDIDFIELLYGFDLVAAGNHDAIVLDALIPGSPLAALLDVPGATAIDCQPVIGLSLGGDSGIEVHFEVKTRPGNQAAREVSEGQDPISVYLMLKKHGPVSDVSELPKVFGELTRVGEELVESRLVPGLLTPIREAIASGNS